MTDFRDRVSKLLKTCTKTFGEDCLLLPKRGGRYNIKGIFDNDYEAVDPDTEQVISSNQPVLGINLHEIPIEIRPGDQLKIRNLTFNIYEIREDGQGGASLLMHKVEHGKRIKKKKD